jgi:hypothetical protein
MTVLIRSNQPIKRDFVFKRGADFAYTFKVKENLTTAKDTTDWTALLTIKSGPNGETYDTHSVGDGITHTPASGQFVLNIPAATIDTYDFQRASYDFILTDDSGNKRCPIYGEITFIP